MYKLGGKFFFLKYPQNPTTLPGSLKQLISRKSQDTLQQSQEQLQSAQMMIEETQSRHLAVYQKYCGLKRLLRTYQCVYKLVSDQLQDRDKRYRSYIENILSKNVCQTLPSLHRILKKQPVIKIQGVS